MTLGELIREYRETHDISQRQFAERCGISNGYIAMLEKGKNPATGKAIIPSLDKYATFANVMGMSLEDLFHAIDSNSLVRMNVSSDGPEHKMDRDATPPERMPRFKSSSDSRGTSFSSSYTIGSSDSWSYSSGSSTRSDMTQQERRLLTAFRNADERAREDAINILLTHPQDRY